MKGQQNQRFIFFPNVYAVRDCCANVCDILFAFLSVWTSFYCFKVLFLFSMGSSFICNISSSWEMNIN